MESQCVEYAADSEDEDWLDTTMNSENQDRLSIANLEKIIWKLELANSMVTQHMLRKAGKINNASFEERYQNLCSVGASMMERKSKGSSAFMQPLSKAAAVKLLKKHEGFESTVIERVYEYWARKRRARKEPLLRTLQPKTAANDRDPDHTFREREKVKRPNTRRRRHVNRGENVEEKLNEIKDEMGHVCNILRSMINRESVKAHVVNVYVAQKRLLLDKLSSEEQGQTSKLTEIRKDQKKKERYLKRDDAEYRAKICRFLLQNVFHGQLRKMFASARGTEGEGGCDAAISRRLRKAQKRRQKVISFLVQDRNWQKWHDKTWMQKMYIILKKRSILGSMTRYVHQKRTWRRWDAFVKLTRDRRQRKMIELAQKRRLVPGHPGKTTKMLKSTGKPSSDSKSDPGKVTDIHRKKAIPRPNSAPHSEGGESHGDGSGGDATSAEAVAGWTVAWAQRQGIVAPKAPRVTKTINIPSTFVVPQNGFSCLPPRLKEMYTEAEKDAMQPPDQVSRKIKALRLRRQRLRQIQRDGQAERTAAVAQFNQEWQRDSERKHQKDRTQRLQRDLLETRELSQKERVKKAYAFLTKNQRGKTNSVEEFVSPGQPMDEGMASEPALEMEGVTSECLSCENYAEMRRKVLLFLKQKIRSLSRRSSEQQRNNSGIPELKEMLERFWQLKSAKIPDLCLMEALIGDLVTAAEQDAASDGPASSADISDEGTSSAIRKKRKRSRNKVNPRSKATKSNQEVESSKERKTDGTLMKRVYLIKRPHRRLALEIRLRGRNKTMQLKPGQTAQFNAFPGDGQQMDIDMLRRHIEAEDVTSEMADERVRSTAGTSKESAMDPKQRQQPELSAHWNSLCSRDGPVAQVSVHSHRMIKAQSAPVLVTSDECYPPNAQHNKTKSVRRNVAVGMGASLRLLKGKGISLSALNKRQRLRRQILKPLLPRIEANRSLPKTKLRKIQALLNVKMQVPSRPERKPLFCYAFKLDNIVHSDKIPANMMKSPPYLPPEVLRSGLTRVGRGNRMWVDRVDPLTLRRSTLKDGDSARSVGDLIPTLQRVLKSDQRKRRVIRQKSIQRSLYKRKLEEKKAQKINEMQESATQLANRQQNFLPYCVVQCGLGKDARRGEKAGKTREEVDTKKEAQRLYGTMMEVGVPLPMQHLLHATSSASAAALAAGPSSNAMESAQMRIKTEPPMTMGMFHEERNQNGAQVTTPSEAPLEDGNTSIVMPREVMSSLGRIRSEGVLFGSTSTRFTQSSEVRGTKPGAFRTELRCLLSLVDDEDGFRFRC